MVTERCRLVVDYELDKLKLLHEHSELGSVEITNSISADSLALFANRLQNCGLELIENNRHTLVEQIKNTIIQMVYYDDTELKEKKSIYLCKKLGYNYTYLSNVFSYETGDTIEHYIIKHRIERVKELLSYKDLNLTQISYLLNYSSVAHLSAQFKHVTGYTPTSFINSIQHSLIAIDKL
jgi:AraC-like DNA-binding protein